VNIGVAVALGEGLMVPVLKNANQKGVTQLSQEVRELVNNPPAKQVALRASKRG